MILKTYFAYKISNYIPNFLLSAIKLFAKALPKSDKKVPLSFKIKRFTRDFNKNKEKQHIDWMATFNDDERKVLLQKNFINSNNFFLCDNKNNLLTLQLNDINHYLAEDILKKVDTASMLNSLEVRVPFLDYRLVPLILSLPDKYKIKSLKTKYLLKSFARKLLPKIILKRKKRGFTVPISSWIKELAFIQQYLTENMYFEHNLLNKSYINDLFFQHKKGLKNNARQLWLVFVFNYWWYNFYKKELT